MVNLFIPGSHQKSITFLSSILVETLLAVGSNYFAVNCFDDYHYVFVIVNVFVEICSVYRIIFIDEFCFFDRFEIGFKFLN